MCFYCLNFLSFEEEPSKGEGPHPFQKDTFHEVALHHYK